MLNEGNERKKEMLRSEINTHTNNSKRKKKENISERVTYIYLY